MNEIEILRAIDVVWKIISLMFLWAIADILLQIKNKMKDKLRDGKND